MRHGKNLIRQTQKVARWKHSLLADEKYYQALNINPSCLPQSDRQQPFSNCLPRLIIFSIILLNMSKTQKSISVPTRAYNVSELQKLWNKSWSHCFSSSITIPLREYSAPPKNSMRRVYEGNVPYNTSESLQE